MSSLWVSQYEGLVEWLLIDLTAFGGQVHRFVNSSTDRTRSEPTPDFFGAVDWQGETWMALPFETASWRRGEKNEKPKIVLPDYESQFSTELRARDNAPGAPIERYQTIGLGMPIGTDRYRLAKVQTVAGFKVTLELANITSVFSSRVPAFVMMRDDYPGLGSALQR